ncbi:MAG: TetR/AcrR family transcriptional regulator [Actinomycetota bacterium]|nr:TetR/AcrR family transcriptional regulator [Actinomycetota bacterium]
MSRIGASDRPARGTRPRNRRTLIVAAATDLFYERGYGNVAMSDVAGAVAIGPSALYRHFAGKRDLLATVVEDALRAVDAAIGDTAADADPAQVLAEVALAHRKVGVLLRREARHLDEQDRIRLGAISAHTADALARRVADLRPGLGPGDCALVARCALAVTNSVSFHSCSLPHPAMTALLARMIAVALWVPLDPPAPAAAAREPVFAPAEARREAILGAATQLFAERGFTGVSMDDIGAAAGMAGPSIYHHFDSKTEILAAAMDRGEEWLRTGFTSAVGSAGDPAAALRRVLDSYLAFAFGNPHNVAVLLSETAHLPASDARRIRRAQRRYIDDWVRLAQQAQPQWSDSEARIRVQAAQMLINETALSRWRGRHRHLARIVTAIACGIVAGDG